MKQPAQQQNLLHNINILNLLFRLIGYPVKSKAPFRKFGRSPSNSYIKKHFAYGGKKEHIVTLTRKQTFSTVS